MHPKQTITLSPVQPYRFDLILDHWGHSPNEILDIAKKNTFYKVFSLDGKLFLISLKDFGAVAGSNLQLQFLNGPATDREVS